MRRHTLAILCALAMASALPTDIDAQGRRGGGAGAPGGRSGAPPSTAAAVPDDPFSGPVVTNAPFSADAITTVTQVLGDGTRIEQSTTAKFYRDSAGRVRREQTIIGLDALNPSGEPKTVITIDPDPGDELGYTLDPVARTARRGPRGGWTELFMYLSGPSNPAKSVGLAVTRYAEALRDGGRQVRLRAEATSLPASGTPQPEESLGTRQIDGVMATGRRTKSVIPLGQIGNDRPIEIIDERWESADLRLLIRSRHHDPRTGDVEYRLTNIVRGDPPADLFTVPADYEILGAGAVGGRTGGGGGQPGTRTGGGGARSGGGR